MALNVDRIERVERNEATNDTNLYFIGGARLMVTDVADDLIDRVVEAKARVVARAFAMAGEGEASAAAVVGGSSGPPGSGPQLRVVHLGEGD
jgi:uncharacterized protein YlzI (FlbEa/FlbD family)